MGCAQITPSPSLDSALLPFLPQSMLLSQFTLLRFLHPFPSTSTTHAVHQHRAAHDVLGGYLYCGCSGIAASGRRNAPVVRLGQALPLPTSGAAAHSHPRIPAPDPQHRPPLHIASLYTGHPSSPTAAHPLPLLTLSIHRRHTPNTRSQAQDPRKDHLAGSSMWASSLAFSNPSSRETPTRSQNTNWYYHWSSAVPLLPLLHLAVRSPPWLGIAPVKRNPCSLLCRLLLRAHLVDAIPACTLDPQKYRLVR